MNQPANDNLPSTVSRGIGKELLRRGNRVRVLGHEAQRKTVEAAGLDFRAYRNSPRWTPTEDMSSWTVLTMLLAMLTNPGIGRDLLDEVREDPADLVIIDCMLFNALDAAGRGAAPRRALFHTFYGFFDGLFRRGPFGIYPRSKGLGPRRLWRQADLAMVCSDRDLDPAGGRADDGQVVWTGAVHDARKPAVGRTPPLVLASLSTGGFPGQRAALQNIIDAADGMDVELVVTTGPAVDPTGLRSCANTTVQRYVSHNELMPTCSAVIGHGGHATTFRALAHDLPMLIMPMYAPTDQPTIGKAVAAAGAGKVLRKNSAPHRIRDALDELLRSEHYRAAAATLGARIRATDGATVAAERLLALLDD